MEQTQQTSWEPEGIVLELQQAQLGDRRREQRLMGIVAAAAARPEESFPEQARSEAALEGTYRFLGNKHVSPKAVLAPHIQQTVERARAAKVVLAVQDTTMFSFSGEARREGSGRLLHAGQGFFAHYNLAIGLDGRPLGTLGLETLVRGPKCKGRQSPAQARADESNEQRRWLRRARLAGERLGPDVHVIHVADREADDYALFAQISALGQSAVIRVFRDRRLHDDISASLEGPSEAEAGAPMLFATMDHLPVRGRRTIDLSARDVQGFASNRAILSTPRVEREKLSSS